MMCELEGKHADWKRLCRRFGSPDGTNSMVELQQAAIQYGINVEGYSVPASDAQELRTPFIFFNRKHYVVVVRTGLAASYVFDPPSKVVVIPNSLLFGPELWGNGYVLAQPM